MGSLDLRLCVCVLPTLQNMVLSVAVTCTVYHRVGGDSTVSRVWATGLWGCRVPSATSGLCVGSGARAREEAKRWEVAPGGRSFGKCVWLGLVRSSRCSRPRSRNEDHRKQSLCRRGTPALFRRRSCPQYRVLTPYSDPKTDSSRPCWLAWLDGGVLAFCHIKDRRQEGLKWRCTCLGASKAGSVSSRFLPSGARAPLPQFHSACAHPDIRRDPAGEGFGNEMDVGESCCSVAVLSAPEPEGSLGVSVWRGALLHTALCTSPPPDRGP